MMIKDWLEVIDYKITEGSEYGWTCFGDNAYCLDHWDNLPQGKAFHMVFDRRLQTVFQAEAHDYKNNRSYRWTHPNWRTAHADEVLLRGVDDVAYDDVKFIELEIVEDWLEKARAIYLDEPYDARIEVPLTLPDEQMFELMKLAHEQDITLNQLVEQILTTEIDKLKLD